MAKPTYSTPGMCLWPKEIRRRYVWSARVNHALTRLRELPPPVRLAFVLLLIVLAASLAGCATRPTSPSESPRNPEPPPSRLAERSETWSDSVARDLQKWQQMLTSPEAKPAN